MSRSTEPEASCRRQWRDKAVWPMAVESADKEAWRLAFEIATMPKEERENLTLVGHSLGGRIVARVLARLAEKNLRVREALLMAAAIPYISFLRVLADAVRNLL